MSVRLKLLLAVLAAGVGLSFWYVTGSSWADTEGTASVGAASAALEKVLCGDTDADGLCDYDETYWDADFMNPDTDGDGFKDGEEVLSGHDPAKAGPDDYLDEKRNLTQRVSALVLGAITSGTLDRSNPSYSIAVNELVDEIFEQYDANVAVELDSFMISSGSEEDLLSYGIRMTSTLEPMFDEIAANHDSLMETLRGVPVADIPKIKVEHPEVFKAFTLASSQEARAFDGRVDSIKSIVAPYQMEKFHRSVLLYLRGTQQRYRTLSTVDQDPVTALISLQVIRTLAIQTPLELIFSLRDQLTDAINNQ